MLATKSLQYGWKGDTHLSNLTDFFGRQGDMSPVYGDDPKLEYLRVEFPGSLRQMHILSIDSWFQILNFNNKTTKHTIKLKL